MNENLVAFPREMAALPDEFAEHRLRFFVRLFAELFLVIPARHRPAECEAISGEAQKRLGFRERPADGLAVIVVGHGGIGLMPKLLADPLVRCAYDLRRFLKSDALRAAEPAAIVEEEGAVFYADVRQQQLEKFLLFLDERRGFPPIFIRVARFFQPLFDHGPIVFENPVAEEEGAFVREHVVELSLLRLGKARLAFTAEDAVVHEMETERVGLRVVVIGDGLPLEIETAGEQSQCEQERGATVHACSLMPKPR